MKPIVTIHGPGPAHMRRILAEEFTRHYGLTAGEFARSALLDLLLYGSYDDRITDAEFRMKAPKGPFLWLTHGGDLIDPRDMPTPHLYYSLRMIFNHSVPAEFRTPGEIKHYPDVPHWTPEYRKAAVDALDAELRTRNPKGLEPAMQEGLRWMRMAARAILNEGI